MGRVFAHGELHLALLALIRRRPMHGYELMTCLQSMLDARYRPSAGSIYPALSALVAEGLLERRRAGRRQLYQLTPTGAEALEDRSEALAMLELRTGVRFDGTGGIDGHLARFGARVNKVAPSVDANEVAEILDAAAEQIERLVAQPANEEEMT